MLLKWKLDVAVSYDKQSYIFSDSNKLIKLAQGL